MELWSACRVLLFPVQMLFHIVRASLAALLPSRRKDLSREVVLVTGGGRGIGRHLAKEFARQGARKVSPTERASERAELLVAREAPTASAERRFSTYRCRTTTRYVFPPS